MRIRIEDELDARPDMLAYFCRRPSSLTQRMGDKRVAPGVGAELSDARLLA